MDSCGPDIRCVDIDCRVMKMAFLALCRVFYSTKLIRFVRKEETAMDQKKIGSFLKELRNQKGLTQEQLAEQFCVSSRTVSRWENGNNMPDLDVLIEISDYYEVDLREILNGERKSENMEKEMKEAVLQAVDYTNTEAERYNKRVRICNAIAILLMLGYTILKDSSIYNDNSIVMAGIEFAQGMAIGMLFVVLFVGLVMSSRYGAKIRAFKQRLLKKNVI